MQNYLTEYMAENFRTGEEIQPDENNKVTVERRRVKRQLHETAKRKGVPVEEVALEFTRQNRPDIERYIVTQNETPADNDAELATQATIIRANQIQTVARTMDLPLDKAELFLEAAEAEAMQNEHPDADNFLGGLLEGVGPVASKGLNILADKHAKTHGGKRGVAGFFADIFGPKEDKTAGQADPNAQSYNLGVMAKEIVDKVTDNKKKQVISQNIPLIIGIVVAIIVITVLIARRK